MDPPRPRPHRPRVASSRRLLGALLVSQGALSPEELEEALQLQCDSGERLGEILVRLGKANEEEVWQALAGQLGLPFHPPPLAPEATAVRVLPPALARRKRVLPLALTPREVHVALGDPLDLAVVDEIQFRTGRRVRTVVTTPSSLRSGLVAAYGTDGASRAPATPPGSVPGSRKDPGEDPAEAAHGSEPPEGSVSRQVETLLRRAVESRASDLHIEQGREEVVIRERVDGVLRRVTSLPGEARLALLSRIKVVAGMDISVKRRPQDGGFPFRHGPRILSVRVSTLPVEGGEKAVLRLLDPTAVPSALGNLGLGDQDLARLREMIRAGRGVILVAGPTGSGKSSTLFGALGELDREGLNIVTLEDPIEYRVEGVNQVQVNARAGLTFPAALRSVLRQDPDVIMVGEIRDRETAEIAMAAAMTGHLVLSTVHTIDAPGAVTRLLQMGVASHLVAGGLSGVVSQRLLRRRCPSCGGHGGDCPRCHAGYRGRTGVFQVLVMDDALREEVLNGASTGVLRRLAERGGMGSMADDARRKVAEGTTTPHEVSRVLSRDPGASRPCRGCGGPVPAGGVGCPACGRATVAVCPCGTRLRQEWRFCPQCLRPAGRVPLES
jgi:type IV pilus assembly protein PilB